MKYHGWTTEKINNFNFKIEVWEHDDKKYGRIKQEGHNPNIYVYQWYQSIKKEWRYITRTDHSAKRPWIDFKNLTPYNPSDVWIRLKKEEKEEKSLRGRYRSHPLRIFGWNGGSPQIIIVLREYPNNFGIPNESRLKYDFYAGYNALSFTSSPYVRKCKIPSELLGELKSMIDEVL